MEEMMAQGEKDFHGKAGLTLANFVVGDSNIVAFAAAKEVSESPGTKYNPLYIWGDVGQGKSHLLNGIGWEFKRRNPDGIVELVDGEEFSEELADIRDKRSFREKYSRPDVLLIDNFHVLTEAARAEVLRIFEVLQSANKQLVLGSLRSPEELDIDDRLRSRIEGGLVCKIHPPDLETRISILKQKAEKAGVGIQESILEEIAAKVTMNVRKLEGAINRLVVLSKARDEMISSEFASSALRDMMPEVPREEVFTYQEPAEGGGSEFSDFISDVAKTISRISPEPSEQAKMREAYAEKMYVWEMKGFVVDRLRVALNKKMDVLASEFISFTSDVQRLIELQNRFGALNAKRFPQEASAIERLLFDPDAVDELTKRIDDLESRLSTVAPDLVEDYTFDTLIVNSFNEEACRICRSIADARSTAPELVFLWGEEGVGKSHLLNAVAKEVYENRAEVNVFLLHGEIFVDDLKIERGRHARGRLRERCLEADLLLADDVPIIFENEYSADEFMAILDQRIASGRKVILASDEPPEKTYQDPGFARLMSKGVVCRIGEPTENVKQEIARRYLLRKDVIFSRDEIDDVCASIGANLWELMDRLDQMVKEKRGESLLEGVSVVEDKSAYEPTPTEEGVAGEVAAPPVEEEAEAAAGAEEEAGAPSVEEEGEALEEAEEEVAAQPVEEEAEAAAEEGEEAGAPSVEEEGEALEEEEEEVSPLPVEEEAEAAAEAEEEAGALSVEEEAEALEEEEEEVSAPPVEEEAEATAGEPGPPSELELEAFVEAAEEAFTPLSGTEVEPQAEVKKEPSPPVEEEVEAAAPAEEAGGEFAPPSEAEVEALLEAADEIFAPPSGVEIEPSPGAGEEATAPSLAEVFTPPEVAERRVYPSEPRAVEDIMDASWEVEGERLMESI